MRLSLIVGLGLLGLAGCSINSPPPAVAPAAVVATPPTTTYVTPSAPAVVGVPGTTVITHP
ncbi:MAG: hypothetical protein ABI224_15340 [Acetobacteraceae bacterium]